MAASPSDFDPRHYWEDRLRGEFSLAGVGYARLGRRFNAAMYRIRGEVFDRAVARHLGPTLSGTVVDVGSGTGFYVDRWQRLGAAVVGVDLTEVAVERLRARFPSTEFLQADIGADLTENLERLVGRVDVVSAFDVLFHIVDDARYARALSNISRLLRPGGLFFWSDNFIRRPTIRVAHQVSRSLDETTAALDAAGLAVVERVPMFVLMNYPADARSALARWAWTLMVAPAMVSDLAGGVLGAVLSPLERRLVRRLRESPSTELMVCRRAG